MELIIRHTTCSNTQKPKLCGLRLDEKVRNNFELSFGLGPMSDQYARVIYVSGVNWPLTSQKEIISDILLVFLLKLMSLKCQSIMNTSCSEKLLANDESFCFV